MRRLASRHITLTSDFGLFDSYVGQLKGVVCSSVKFPVQIIDLTHSIEFGNIGQASCLLAESFTYFPDNTLHLVIVDPGVGSQRKPVIVKLQFQNSRQETSVAWFVGPDNGVFSGAMSQAIEIQGWCISNSNYVRRVGNTFDGRDLFAPVAARLLNGEDPNDFATEVAAESLLRCESAFVKTPIRCEGTLFGEIVRFDHFGNAITNIAASELRDDRQLIYVEIGEDLWKELRVVRYYAEIKPSEIAVLTNSQGLLEIAANLRGVRDIYSLEKGVRVKICRTKKLY